MERMNTRRAIPCVVLPAPVATGCVRKPVTAPPARRHAGPDLRPALGDVRTLAAGDEAGAARSPGMRYRHYAPRGQVVVVTADENAAAPRPWLESFPAGCDHTVEHSRAWRMP